VHRGPAAVIVIVIVIVIFFLRGRGVSFFQKEARDFNAMPSTYIIQIESVPFRSVPFCSV